MHTEIGRFSNYAIANPVVIAAALKDNFSVSSLVKVANDNGYGIGTQEVDAILSDLTANTTARASYRDSNGEIRELTIDESDLAGGGQATAVATVVVLVVAAVGAVVATAAAVAVDVATVVNVYVWMYGGEDGDGE